MALISESKERYRWLAVENQLNLNSVCCSLKVKLTLKYLIEDLGVPSHKIISFFENREIARNTARDFLYQNTNMHNLKKPLTTLQDWRMKVVAVSVVSAYVEGSVSQPSGFKTKVLVQHMEAGPQPDTASFIQKLEQDKLAKQRGETKDNRSFLAK